MMTKLKRGDLVYLSGKTFSINNQATVLPAGRWQDLESNAIYLGLLTPDEEPAWDDMERYYNFYVQSTGQTYRIGHRDDGRAASRTGSWKDLIYAMNHGNYRLNITLPDGTVH